MSNQYHDNPNISAYIEALMVDMRLARGHAPGRMRRATAGHQFLLVC